MEIEYVAKNEVLSTVDNQEVIAGNDNLSLIDVAVLEDDIFSLPAADVRPVVQREAVMQALNKYFSIGDSYTYELNRVKEAFYVGTMKLDDFEEWNEDNVSDLCDYLMKEIFGTNCGADMREEADGRKD